MNILFTICGRAGSKGIKDKNFRIFLGYPLIFYTFSALDIYIRKNPQINSHIVVNTDSDALISLLQEHLKLPIDVIKRKPHLGLDDTPKLAVILDCLKEMNKRVKLNYDMVVDLDITSPLRSADDISNLINKKIDSDADVVFSITDSRRNPYFNMVKQTEFGYERVIQSTFNTRQEAPEVFDMNASLYAYSPKFLEEERGIFEGKCDVIWMKDTAVLDLDHENDFEIMEIVAKHFFEKIETFGVIKKNLKKILNDKRRWN